MPQTIDARGIRVHNLKNIDVSIPMHRLTLITGVSGSGKSSLAFDTLYAEGQRRYIECFSTWARQYLDQLPRPDVDRVERIPPAVAIRQHRRNTNSRATVATATEVDDYLRLLFARVGEHFCPDCDCLVRAYSPEDVADAVAAWPEDRRLQICFQLDDSMDPANWLATLKSEGLDRLIVGNRTRRLDDVGEELANALGFVVLDRLKTGSVGRSRLTESIESAMDIAGGHCSIFLEADAASPSHVVIDEKPWTRHGFTSQPSCPECQQVFGSITPQSFSFNSPRGACPACSGFGSQASFSFDKLVPDDSLSLAEGAIVPWTTPAYQHELEELLELADDYDLPTDVPFCDLTDRHRALIRDGVSERAFGGLRGFFDWLHRHRYKKGVGVFLARWRSFETCTECDGSRLNRSARSIRVGGLSLAAMSNMCAPEVAGFLRALSLSDEDQPVAAPLVQEILTRLDYLTESGVGYLAMGRSMRTMSAGESQRVALTAALGSNLVNTLYVLDEPTAGLHATDTRKIIKAVQRLKDLGNTVVVVEHDSVFIQEADHVIEIGPGAGSEGGEAVFAGTIEGLLGSGTATSKWLSNSSSSDIRPPRLPREPRGWLSLAGATTNNLRDLTVRFPVGVLCVVTGVSGSGKSSLVDQTLYPAACRQLGVACDVEEPGQWEALDSLGEIANVIMVDQQPIGRTPRSVPATYLDVFGDIRKVFAETSEAKKRDFGLGMFSFNSTGGGRCPRCEGAGSVTIDMHFMADVEMTCPECDGSRYRPEVLEARYRGLSIADVLNLTADEAFLLFRGRNRLQKKLKVLRDAGLGYLPLGQSTMTLSGGEAQRLKMASHLASLASKATRQTASDRFATLFLLDEPSVGLHGQDVTVLLRCFDALLEAGHSLIVVEHNRDIVAAADHIIDVGPGPGAGGGMIVASGPPEAVRSESASLTGAMLRGEV